MKTKILFTLATMLIASAPAFAAKIATVGEKTINTEDHKAEYSQISDEQRAAINKDDTTRRGIVENAVNGELLVQAATKAGLDKDPDYMKALERFKRQYLASRFMQKSLEPKLERGEVKKFYETNKNMFDTSQVCAHHIVVSDAGTATKIAEELKKKKNKKGAIDLKAFEQMAAKSSIDPTAQDNKGELGCFTRERMVPEFSAAAFSMKKNTISDPVRTMFGYHVILVTDHKQGKVAGFEEVEQKVKDSYRMKLMQDMLTDLRTKSNVSINEDALKEFKL